MRRIRPFILAILVLVSVCSCATTQPPGQGDEMPFPPCPDILPLLDGCVDQGVMKKPCEESELIIYTRVFAQTNSEEFARKAGTACLLSCQSGNLQLGDIEAEWRDKFGGCR
jgi:hypothetical protein